MNKEAKIELKEWIKRKYKKIDSVKADNTAEQLYKSGKMAGLKEVLKEFCKDVE